MTRSPANCISGGNACAICEYSSAASCRCVEKFGGDLVILTTQGALPLSSVVGGPIQERSYITDKIRKAFSTAVSERGFNKDKDSNGNMRWTGLGLASE